MRSGRPATRRRARRSVAALAVVALSFVGAACGTTTTTFPPLGSTTAPAGAAATATVRSVIAAAGAKRVAVGPADHPYRPPEGALLAAAPRSVLQAKIPDDPSHGYVIVYELGSAAAAETAARDEASYIASGPGRVQFVPDTRYVIRVVDSTVVFFHWSPDASPSSLMGDLASGLETLGTGVVVPS